MRWLCALVATSFLLPATAAVAQEEPDIEFFYPVVTRRPVIERELELRVKHEKGRDGRETEMAAAIELPLLPRWQIELEAAGFELTLPSGSERRGLGGEFAVEPFVSAGIALGPFDLLGNVAYEWNLNSHVEGQWEQQLTVNLALGYRVSWWLTPFLELDSVTRTSGAEDEGGPRLRDRVQLYLTPGFNVRPLPGMTFRAGVQLPLTDALTFDYAVHAGLVWEF